MFWRYVKLALGAAVCSLSMLFADLDAQETRSDLPPRFIVFVHSAGCPPCARMMPQARVASANGIPIYQVKAWLHPEWVKKHRIRMYPCLLLVVNGEVTRRSYGYCDSNYIEEFYRR